MLKNVSLISLLLIAALFIVLNGMFPACSQESLYVSRIDISVFYDVIDDLGFVEENISLNTVPTQLIEIDAPLIPPPIGGRGYYELINISYSSNHKNVYLSYSVDRKNNMVKLVFNATRTVLVRYAIYNYLDEIGVGVYGLLIDLSNFSIANSIHARIRIIGNYTVDVYPSLNTGITKSKDVVAIELNDPQPYTIIIVEEGFGGITTLPTTSPTTNVETGAQQQPLAVLETNNLILILVVAVIALLLLYLFWRRHGADVEVETIAPGDILSDETVRDIIVTVGDSGGEIKQSDLVRATGRPKSTISRKVKRLAEEGYTEIIRKGKYNIVKLTPQGKEIYEKIKSGEKSKNER
ncbi:helix-turn-helix transcriptional regulator [Staphylothermus hellenicus]|uniref:helix-turn-helix transcriptional regulator n=1 Tax=Staphylothermus hellenicus TaxID=84599 RepID=UPI0011E4E34A|nr:MarR family transcriptional regulator [Staphylothermus hellenicus]